MTVMLSLWAFSVSSPFLLVEVWSVNHVIHDHVVRLCREMVIDLKVEADARFVCCCDVGESEKTVVKAFTTSKAGALWRESHSRDDYELGRKERLPRLRWEECGRRWLHDAESSSAKAAFAFVASENDVLTFNDWQVQFFHGCVFFQKWRGEGFVM